MMMPATTATLLRTNLTHIRRQGPATAVSTGLPALSAETAGPVSGTLSSMKVCAVIS